MGLYDTNRGVGISILKWDSDLRDYVFDHDPASVVHINQEHKYVHINKDSRRVCILDRDDIGFNDELTIYISSFDNVVKTGARNLIRMFQRGWLVTKQSCYILLRCNVGVATTSCSIINMQDTNVIHCAHKTKIIGRNDNSIASLTGNDFKLRDGNHIRCTIDNVIHANDNNAVITGNRNVVHVNDNNVILCQDNCIIHAGCGNTIVAGSNCTIYCSGNNNFISTVNECTVHCNEFDTIFCGDECQITAGTETGITVGLEGTIIRNDIATIEYFDELSLITNDTGIEEYEPIYGLFQRDSFIAFFTQHVLGIPGWEYGEEDPIELLPAHWMYAVGHPELCEDHELWIDDDIFAEKYDSCCPMPEPIPEPPEPNYDTSTLCSFGVNCLGGPGGTGGLGYTGAGIFDTSSATQLELCEVPLEFAAEQGWFRTFDEYLETVEPSDICVLDSSSYCTFFDTTTVFDSTSLFDTTSIIGGCPFDATSVCKLTKIEVSRTIVMTGGTGGTGGTGSPVIPDSHLFVPICG